MVAAATTTTSSSTEYGVQSTSANLCTRATELGPWLELWASF